MYSFRNDYSEGAHPLIIKALTESNLEQTEGYGEDCYSKAAIKQLKKLLASTGCVIKSRMAIHGQA